MRRLAVTVLERLCGLVGHVGGHAFADLSSRLDERWNTGVWRRVN